MTESSWQDDRYECIEPELGRDIWRLDLPGLAADERQLLTDHVAFCDACRLYQAMDREFAAGLADGSLSLGPDDQKSNAPPARLPVAAAPRYLGLGAGLALAASLCLMFILPPEARDNGGASRSDTEPLFARPVEGEVVTGQHVDLRWRAIPGASRYRLRVDAVAGDFRWEGETSGLNLDIPITANLRTGADLRAYLVPVPADLAPLEGHSVSFRTGSFGSFLGYRARAAAWPARWLGLAGLLTACGAVWVRIRRA